MAEYLIKSGYKIALDLKTRRMDKAESNTMHEEEKGMWKKLWNLNIKGKIKLFCGNVVKSFLYQ